MWVIAVLARGVEAQGVDELRSDPGEMEMTGTPRVDERAGSRPQENAEDSQEPDGWGLRGLCNQAGSCGTLDHWKT